MEFLPNEIDEYTVKHTAAASSVLEELDRETNMKVLQPRMLSGHLQGRVLSMISKMIQPKQILEIGTYTGYSCICLAEGLLPGGTIHTIDINEELEEMFLRYFSEAGIKDKVLSYIGNALEIVPNIDHQFDIVFIDADKENYSNYYNLVFDKVRTGGFIIADNVLWSGKVTGSKTEMDLDTRSLVEYCEMVDADERVENVLFPIRDGLMVVRKM